MMTMTTMTLAKMMMSVTMSRWSMRSSRSASGTALVAVLVVILVTSMSAVSLLYRMQAEFTATAAGLGSHQAWCAAMSGVQRAALQLGDASWERRRWYDNPGAFRHQRVYDDGAERWFFTVYAPDGRDPFLDGARSRRRSSMEGVRFGITDESSRLDLHAAGEDLLAKIPGLSESQAAALKDYADRFSDERPLGAENRHYESQPIAYRARDGDLPTLDELILVRGFDAQMLYGDDANLNGRLDPCEDDDQKSFPPDNADGRLDRGLREYLTVWGIGRAVDHRDRRQINLNRDIDRLAEMHLADETLYFLAALRQVARGRAIHHPVDMLDARRRFRLDELSPALRRRIEVDHMRRRREDERRRVKEIRGEAQRGTASEKTMAAGGRDGKRHLTAGAERSAEPSQGGEKAKFEPPEEVELYSGIHAGNLAEWLDRTCAHAWERYRARRVNVNTASAEVLELIPDIDGDLAERIVARRAELDRHKLRTTAWLLTEGIVDIHHYRKIARWLTARGFQFRVQSVGYALPSGRFRAVEAVIDISQHEPRIVYTREITHLGAPFSFADLEKPRA